MKLKVPFLEQKDKLDCGQAALRMVLSYLGEDPGLEAIEEKIGVKEGKGVHTIQMANAAASLGYKVKLFSKYTEFNKDNLELDFYKKYGDSEEAKQKKWDKEAEDLGVEIIEKTFDLDDLLKLVKEDSIPIILLDWYVIREKEGYNGHFVPIVGYDEENVLIHNQGIKGTQSFMPIKKELFDKARKAKGTDEDVMVISKV